MSQPPTQTPVASISPCYRADKKYVTWPIVFVVVCLIIMAIGIGHKEYTYIALFGMMALAFLALLLSAATLRVTMNEDGMKQRWIWGWRTVSWNEIATIERIQRRFFGDGLFLLSERGNEIFAVSSLPLADQQAVTAEAIKRARLRKDKAPLKRGIAERWVRK